MTPLSLSLSLSISLSLFWKPQRIVIKAAAYIYARAYNNLNLRRIPLCCFIMDAIPLVHVHALARLSAETTVRHHRHHQLPCVVSFNCSPVSSILERRRFCSSEYFSSSRRSAILAAAAAGMTNSVPPRTGSYRVGDFMTKKEYLHVFKTTTTVDEALKAIVEKKVTGFPVVGDDWKLVGLVSDYDLLALDSISGGNHINASLFPDVDSSWKTFNEIQRLLTKTNGKMIGDLMTHAPLVVQESTNLEDAARLLLETKYHRLPVVDGDGKLIGMITRGSIVRAALQIKGDSEKLP